MSGISDGAYQPESIEQLEKRLGLGREKAQKPDADAGKKFDAGKPPVGLISRSALLAEAEVMGFGAEKYGEHNWRKGMRWSRLGDGALRHLLAWLDGEDIDPESGKPHLAHLRCCAGFLIEYAERGLGTDDRFKGDVT